MLSYAIGISSAVYLWAAQRGIRPVLYVLKPGTMALIILMALGGVGVGLEGIYSAWVVGALFASVAGDIFLMLPSNRFLQGLLAFFVAHCLYIYALWFALPVRLVPADIATGLGMLLYGGYMARRMGEGITIRGEGRMRVPVVVYITVISVMVWRALGLLWQTGPLPVRAWLVALGALLFCLSDSFLGWDRFVRKLPGRDLLVMSTYFAAQYCFALSCTWPA